MKLTSPVFTNMSQIPEPYGFTGKNQNPPLIINDVPEGTASLVLLMHDPDARKKDFLHWAVWNIHSNTATIAEGAIPQGAIIGMNDMKKTNYIRPMPPKGTGMHRYIFELYALDRMLDLAATAPRATIEAAIQTYIITSAKLAGLYSR